MRSPAGRGRGRRAELDRRRRRLVVRVVVVPDVEPGVAGRCVPVERDQLVPLATGEPLELERLDAAGFRAPCHAGVAELEDYLARRAVGDGKRCGEVDGVVLLRSNRL